MAASDAQIEAVFQKFCAQGQGQKAKSTMNQTQMAKFLGDAGVFKALPKLDKNVLGIYWSYAFKKDKEVDFKTALTGWKDVFATRYETDTKGATTKDQFWEKMSKCLAATEGPKADNTTKISKTGNVEGMTDTSKYTGAHKERFDESGKGKGLDGREDRHENSGYVGNYKGSGTYDAKHK